MSQTADRQHVFDDAKFRAAMPFPLQPTNLPGVYTTPTPADDFDPNTASPGDLVRAGLMWKRPDADSRPEFRKAWDLAMSRKWHRIVPRFEVRQGRTHHLRQPPRRLADGSYTDTNWAGAAKKGGNWSTVIGIWQVPTVSQPTEPAGLLNQWNSASWVGIDGYGSSDVLQAGIDQIFTDFGQPQYDAWYEWYVPPPPRDTFPPGTSFDARGYPTAWGVEPGGTYQYILQVVLNNDDGPGGFPVNAGDQIYCSVQYITYNNNRAGHILMGNGTTGAQVSVTLAPPPTAAFAGQSVEWIMEAPDGGEGITSLPDFSTFQFTTAFACGANDTTTNPQLCDTLNITNAAGTKQLTAVSTWQNGLTIAFVG